MSILFDGQARTITLTIPGDISVRAIWTAYIDWLAEGDNSKHLPMLATVGMDSPDIPLYLFLKNGVIFIVLNNSAPTVLYDGTIKTYDGHEPFGGAIVNVRYRDPGIAIGYSIGGSTGPSLESIAAASAAAVLAAMNSLPPKVNTVQLNSSHIIGTGQIGDDWRGEGVQPQII